MRELRCPCCGKVLKVVDETKTSDTKTIKIHCNKCNMDIEFEIGVQNETI